MKWLALFVAVRAAAAPVCWECWAAACMQVESGGRASAVGDGGRSIGAHQMSRAAWEEARRVDPTIGPYDNATNPVISARACIAFANVQAARFERATGRAPNAEELYALYNAGFARLRAVGFDMRRIRGARERARRFGELYRQRHEQQHYARPVRKP